MTPAAIHSIATYVRLLATASLAAVISACTPQAAPPPSPEPDRFAALEADAKIMSHRWTAPDGVNLDAPELQVARGYIESENNYDRTADPLTLYPGFNDVAHAYKSPPTPRTGTITHHILQVEPTTHLEQPVTEIHVCDVHTQTAMPTADGWTRMERRFYTSLRLQQTERATNPLSNLDYEHRLPYPTWNVFDGWEVERFTDKRMGENDPWRICMSQIPGITPDTPVQERLQGSPAIEPFSPGWPTLVDNNE
ncbi:hypothetical protein HCA61_18850 [Rhodococcus sp. HNM0563]|uniref:hypothetical protein n=1 Tax=Rhodococcus sp. HNM0563 TaxID=2716339 RepID=UPI00146DDC75|nr:hypothetical protein [Rhodococcus sp. HNM0563]NLU64307.1 hypothetical protein [Rhodococcus sp. HNM0563]